MGPRDLTIGALARASGLSRSALLYYDRLGLLRPVRRSPARYRLYSELDVKRLEKILLHRRMGIPLKEIRNLLDEASAGTAVNILQRRLRTLDREIQILQEQQRSITRILKQDLLNKEIPMLNKQRWVEIMRSAGLTEKDMHNWHIQFEKMEPKAHQEFLESLGIDHKEIDQIREWARTAKI